MKTNMLTKTLLSFLFVTFFVFSATAQKANFSGTWAFNEGKSQLGEGRFRAPASKLVITQDDKTLAMERTVKGMNDEENVMKEKYTLDGKESVNEGMMNTSKKSVVSWSADNKSLTINSTTVFERDGNTMEIKAVEVFTLSDDGKTLTINSTSTSPRGERKQTIVYTK